MEKYYLIRRHLAVGPHWYSIECPICEGQGEIVEPVPGVYARGPSYSCQYCDETGFVGPFRWWKWHYWSDNPNPVFWKIQQTIHWWKTGEWFRQ